jgi:hypothetical protein
MIDTAAKRRSAAGVAFLPLGPGVAPNASKDQAWRQSAAWSYTGILADSPTPPPTVTSRMSNIYLYPRGL